MNYEEHCTRPEQDTQTKINLISFNFKAFKICIQNSSKFEFLFWNIDWRNVVFPNCTFFRLSALVSFVHIYNIKALLRIEFTGLEFQLKTFSLNVYKRI